MGPNLMKKIKIKMAVASLPSFSPMRLEVSSGYPQGITGIFLN